MAVSRSVSSHHVIGGQLITFSRPVATIALTTNVRIDVRAVAAILQTHVSIVDFVGGRSGVASFLVSMLHTLRPLGFCLAAAVPAVRLMPTLLLCSLAVSAHVRQFVLALQLAGRLPRLLCVRSDSQQRVTDAINMQSL